jgi:hypothetical protein
MSIAKRPSFRVYAAIQVTLSYFLGFVLLDAKRALFDSSEM